MKGRTKALGAWIDFLTAIALFVFMVASMATDEWARACFFLIILMGDGLRVEIRRRNADIHIYVDTVLKSGSAERRLR